MLTKENFHESHIRMLQKQSKKDPALLERAVFAFGLLGAIRRVEMPFIFKGGTCLILLLKHPMRPSTDIDIVVEPDTDVDTYISNASTIFPFKLSDGELRETQMTNYFSNLYPIDCAVLSVNAQSYRKYGTLPAHEFLPEI